MLPPVALGDESSASVGTGPPHAKVKESSITVGPNLPPVPGWLAKRIESGQFIEMGELLPERLGLLGSSADDEGSKTSKQKCKSVASILEWIQCFGIYVAVLARSQPERVPDLLAYQTLMIQAHLEFQGDNWLGYDRNFRLRAASEGNRKWATIDTTLWSLAFSGKGRTTRCRHCFSLFHLSTECQLNQDSQPSSRPVAHPPQPTRQSPRVCYQWNNSPATHCSFPGCRYEHKCALCIRGPWATDADHKAINCPRLTDHQKTSQWPTRGPHSSR